MSEILKCTICNKEVEETFDCFQCNSEVCADCLNDNDGDVCANCDSLEEYEEEEEEVFEDEYSPDPE